MNVQLRYLIMMIVLCIAMVAPVSTTSSTEVYPHNGLEPGSYLAGKAAGSRIILLGDHHKNQQLHSFIINTLPYLVYQSGVDTLFVEIPQRQQAVIDRFLDGQADVEDIEISDIITSRSYTDILSKARDLKMHIVAIDKKDPSPLSRDEWMASHVATYLRDNPLSRGLVLVGERHVLKKLQWTCTNEPSLADYLEHYTPFSIMTWPDATDHLLPVAMEINTLNRMDVKDPTLTALNIDHRLSNDPFADGIILLPKRR